MARFGNSESTAPGEQRRALPNLAMRPSLACSRHFTRGSLVRLLRRTALVATLLLVCSAHIGSPDVWFDGLAGPYKVLVHVQAPPVVPGIATINVRVDGSGVTRVAAFVNRFDATGGTPPPDVATPVPGDPPWYRTRLWVMTAGSNSVTVTVSGTGGEGSVVVPLVAHAARRLEFNGALAIPLAAVGVFLALGLFTIVGATVREGMLPPGEEPDAQRQRRARLAMARAVIVVALAIAGLAVWWRAEDAAFVRRLYRPMPLTASIDSSTGQPRLRLAITDSAWINRNDVAWRRARRVAEPSALIEDHGKLVHLFLISADGSSAFAHLHPATDDTVTFTSSLPDIPAGSYSVFADIVHASGLTQTLTSAITVPQRTGAPRDVQLGPDDSWAVGRAATKSAAGDTARSVLEDGTVLTWARGTRALIAGEEAGLRFATVPPAGDTAALEPFLGMAGHAVVVRNDGKVFIHLHPLGTISLAAQARLAQSSPGAMSHAMDVSHAGTDSLYFPYAFPEPGSYTVWVQVKRHGRVMTGSFPVEVRGAESSLASRDR